MKSPKIYILLVVVMLVMNVVLLFFLFQKTELHKRQRGPHDRHMPGRVHGDLANEFISDLNFTSDQAALFRTSAQNHFEAMRKLDQSYMQNTQQYFEAFEENDSNTIQTLLINLDSLNRQKIEVTRSHFEEIRLMCDDEQLKLFPKFLKKATSRLMGKPKAKGLEKSSH